MLSQFILAATTACGLFASSVHGHMVITSPVPYGASSLNNSPLENDGSDYPCKQRSGVYDIGTMNNMPVGVPQKLAFKGGATHGGGSCQVSVTLDKEPTKDSEWKVIHSIIGGCPSNSPENLSGDPNDKDSSTFQFSIPKGMPNGQYTLAWTWFNKIGNREMYMNCAPIQVTGGSDDNEVYNSLPTMFVINQPNEECGIVAGQDFVFPNPGLYAETAERTALGSATTGSNCAAVTIKGAGTGKPGSPAAPTGAPSGNGSAPYPTTADASAPAYAAPTGATPFRGGAKGVVNGGGDLPKTSLAVITASGNAPPAATSMPAVQQPAAPEASAPASSAPQSDAKPPSYGSGSNDTSSSSGSCSNGAVSCPTPGVVVCIGSDQWGLCDINNCAVPRALSAGTECAAGVVSRRHVAHLRRHIQGGRTF